MSGRQDFLDGLAAPVAATLSALARHPVDGQSLDLQGIADGVEALFGALQSEDIGELVAGAAEAGLFTPDQAQRLLNVAAWGGSLNGAPIRRTAERWLKEGSDTLRVGLALHLDTFPFRDPAEMSAVLPAVASGHPEYAAVIATMLERRSRQGV